MRAKGIGAAPPESREGPARVPRPRASSTVLTQVAVESFEEEDGTLVLELHVADDDVGKVIGRSGRTVNALRDRAAGLRRRKQGRRVLHRRRRLTSRPRQVTAGRVGRAHGLDGSFYVDQRDRSR